MRKAPETGLIFCISENPVFDTGIVFFAVYKAEMSILTYWLSGAALTISR